jgi:hypothetical protein
VSNQTQGYSWRTMPEISKERQEELSKCRSIAPDIEKGIYSFKGMKLSRADVEWLLSTHESRGRLGPVEWNDESQRVREGLDLRGVDLEGADLSRLPLACMRGGLTKRERPGGLSEKEWEDLCKQASVHLKEAQLEGAMLQNAHLMKADLDTAHLEGARLFRADLTGANLRYAYLDRTCNLDSIDLNEAKLADVRWGDVNLGLVAWERVEKLGDDLEASRQKIPARNDPDEGKKNDCLRTYRRAIRANRQIATILRGQGWDEVADKLDYRARILQRKLSYRQGLWRKTGLRTRKKLSRWSSIRMVVSSRSSWLLDWVAGYGYKPLRWLRFYLLTIILFAVCQYKVKMPLLSALSINSQNFHAWYDAFSRSLLALHGRSFIVSSDPYSVINTVEAFVGLVIEAILIAIFTKLILGKSGGGE